MGTSHLYKGVPVTISDATKAKIPNALTLIRLITCWIPGVLVASRPKCRKTRWVATGLFAAIALTDLADGKLARKWHAVSDFGKLWDPVGDKALVGCSGGGLVAGNAVNRAGGIAYFVSNLARDIGVSVLRARKASSKNLIIPANDDGKKKMALQTAGILLALMPPDKRNHKEKLVWACLLTSTWYSLKSAAAYVKA